jgi:hypothetical protein
MNDTFDGLKSTHPWNLSEVDQQKLQIFDKVYNPGNQVDCMWVESDIPSWGKVQKYILSEYATLIWFLLFVSVQFMTSL